MPAQIFLAFFIFSWRLGDTTQYGLLGETVTFNSGITKTISDILWKHNKNKVVEFNGNEQQEYPPFNNRVTLDWLSADLSMSDLRYEDSGTYMLDVYVDNVLHQLSYTLKVIDKVGKPTISCKMNTDANQSGHQAKLTCSAEPTQYQSLMQFEWTSHGQPDPQLTIKLGDEHDEEVYNCTVKYYVSQDSATFTAKDCYEKSSTGQIVGIIVGVVLIIGLVALGIYCKLKYKAKKPSDEESAQSAPDVTHGSIDEKDDKESRKPLLHRSSTRPSEQKLSHLNRHGQDRESVQGCRNAKKQNSQKCPHENEDTENEAADSVEATDDVLSDEQTEDTQHQIADSPGIVENSPEQNTMDVENQVYPHKNEDTKNGPADSVEATGSQHQMANGPQSSTASQHPESDSTESNESNKPGYLSTEQEGKEGEETTAHEQNSNTGAAEDNQQEEKKEGKNLVVDTSQPPQSPTASKPDIMTSGSVGTTADVLSNNQTEGTQHQMADDPQSFTASEQPGVENHEDKVQKTLPPVPTETSSVEATADLLANNQTEGTQHQIADGPQSSTASEQPEGDEDKEEEEDANTDQDAVKSTEANVGESDSTESKVGKGNKVGDLSPAQEGKEGEEATAHEQNSKTDTAEDDHQEEKKRGKESGCGHL